MNRLITLCASFAMLAAPTTAVGAPEGRGYAALLEAVLAQPDDAIANLELARAAEARGKLRHALAAYERAGRADPDNAEARDGYKRMRRLLTPPRTSVTVSAGATHYADARRIDQPYRGVADGSADLTISLEDLRPFAGRRWRTIGHGSGSLHARFEDLSRLTVGAVSGPVFELAPSTDLHLAAGGGVDWLYHRALFAEGSARAELSTLLGGVPQKLAVSIGQRAALDGRSGYGGAVFLEAEAVFTAWDLLVEGDAIHLQPRARMAEAGVAEIGESGTSFLEFGALATYYRPLFGIGSDIGLGIGVYDRSFNESAPSTVDPFLVIDIPGFDFTNEDRRDQMLEGHLHFVGRDFIDENVDLQIDYRLEHNLSNDLDDRFVNHVVGARAVWRY